MLLAAVDAPAVTIDGRVTASAYGYEGNPTDSTASTHLRSHGALRLEATDLGLAGLSLATYLGGTTDLSESAGNDPLLRIHSLYLRYGDHGRRADARAGRQFVQAGVGYGTLDGLRLDARCAGVALTLYGGALVPAGDNGLGSLSDAHLWGARLSTDRLAGASVALSFADREADPIAYASAGRYSGFVGQVGAVRRRLLGAEVSRAFGLHSARGRLDYDLLAEGVRRAELAGRLGLSADLAASAEWLHREPSIYDNSIFSVFPSQPYDEVGLRLFYRASETLGLSVHAAAVLYDGDEAQRLGASATFGRGLTLSYYRSQGYAGGNDGLSGNVTFGLGPRLVLRGAVDLAAYERFEDADERDGLVTAMAGLAWRTSAGVTVDGQLQALRNPAYDADLRALLRASWRFRR